MVRSRSARRGDADASVIFRFLSGIIYQVEWLAHSQRVSLVYFALCRAGLLKLLRFPLRPNVSLLVALLFVVTLAALQFGCASSIEPEVDNTPVNFDINS